MKQFWEGVAGSGKTTRAVALMQGWLAAGIPPEEILILVPQRTLGRPYQQALQDSDVPNASAVSVLTFNGLAQRAISLYWPIVAEKAIPDWDGREPTFLTIETSQYYMTEFVEPQRRAGYFEGVSMQRPRIVAQILDNLSKAAVNRFTLDEVEERLIAAWAGATAKTAVYRTVIDIAKTFRNYCLQYSLLDFSLQIDLFVQHLMTDAAYQTPYRYLIADNVEENFPATFDFIHQIWDDLSEACFIYDFDGGFRLFLGASPLAAYDLRGECDTVDVAQITYIQDEAMINLASAFDMSLTGRLDLLSGKPSDAFTYELLSFYPQMIDWVLNNVANLVAEGVEPQEIVILSPLLSDALRFSIFQGLEQRGIPYISHRPSRAIKDEPVAQAILTLMALAYPDWEPLPRRVAIAAAFFHLIEEMDPLRADLLAQIVYRPNQPELSSFDSINQRMQSRITYLLGERYENLRQWLAEFRENASTVPPDYFIRRLFDFAAQPGYQLQGDFEAARVTSELVESALRFREVISPEGQADWTPLARSYAELVGEGTLAALHFQSWQDEQKNAVFVAPAYTFIMRNRFVDYQFWLDVGSRAWSETIDQPLTHPYVLRRERQEIAPWTDEDESAAQREMLRRLLLGLSRRCRKHIYLAFSDLGEQGYEQRGILLKIFNQILQMNDDGR